MCTSSVGRKSNDALTNPDVSTVIQVRKLWSSSLTSTPKIPGSGAAFILATCDEEGKFLVPSAPFAPPLGLPSVSRAKEPSWAAPSWTTVQCTRASSEPPASKAQRSLASHLKPQSPEPPTSTTFSIAGDLCGEYFAVNPGSCVTNELTA